MTRHGTRQISDDRLEQIRAALADGQSQREIARTLGVTRHTVGRHFPGSGWTQHAAGVFRAATRRLEQGLA